jgi:hypothetical protein
VEDIFGGRIAEGANHLGDDQLARHACYGPKATVSRRDRGAADPWRRGAVVLIRTVVKRDVSRR